MMGDPQTKRSMGPGTMQKVRSVKIGMLLLALALALGACQSEAPEAIREGGFFYNEPDGLNTLDPARMGYRAAIWVGTQLFNGLVELDTTGAIVPSLARRWTVDSTGTRWTFVLRDDVWFHEDSCFGSRRTRRVVASDVKFSFERICDARTKSTGVWVLRDKIAGAAAFFEATAAGKETPKGISGIRVLNDSTVEIQLVKPFAPFLALLTMPYCFIVPREAVEFYGDRFFQHPVGTGPFRFGRWREDVELVLYRNDRYFERDGQGRQLPYLDSIVVTFLKDTKSEFLLFQQGKLDFLSAIDPAFQPQLFDENGHLRSEYRHWQLYQAPAYSIEYYGFLLDTTFAAARRLPFAHSRALRQALNYAVDREALVRYVLRGKGIPAHFGILPPGFPGFDSTVQGYRYDPQRVRQLLAEAGFPDGKGLPEFTLQLGQSERTMAVAEAVQEQWRKFGIRVKLRQVDFPQHLEMVRTGKLAFWRTSWIADYPDPENFLALFYSPFFAPYGPNTTHFAHPVVDSLYERALSPLLSPQQRFQIYHQMEKIVLAEAPWVFLYYNVIQRLAQPWIRGFFVDGSDRLLLKYVWKQQGQ